MKTRDEYTGLALARPQNTRRTGRQRQSMQGQRVSGILELSREEEGRLTLPALRLLCLRQLPKQLQREPG